MAQSKLPEPHEINEKTNYGLQPQFSMIIVVCLSLTANRIRLSRVEGCTSCLPLQLPTLISLSFKVKGQKGGGEFTHSV